ncbi:GATA transcription factor 19-like [Bidens hawaiensis]|uniref:GATA transcription factor 19-like n=1 Tax=Bidens hawaiensis TaxID=980011 RepID=UPI0040492EDE
MPYDQHICPYDSSSTVDCTLSLATPSTRLISDDYRGLTVANPAAVARRCANCHTTSTPLWRNGPRGPKSLCNACGIRFKKEERRAATVVEGYTTGNTQTAATHKLPSFCSPGTVGGEFRFIDEVDDRDSKLMSWRLNATDRAGLVHDFTRY